MLKRTPLFAKHQAAGAKLIDFGGWEMPVQYTSIVEEHIAVRTAAGLFDISHMGEIFVSGAAARDFLNHTLTNDLRKLAPGVGQYSLMCNEKGGVIDDLYVYCLGLGNYLVMVNASRIEADLDWMLGLHKKFSAAASVIIENNSDSYGAVALQGPNVASFIDEALPNESSADSLASLAKNQIRPINFAGELIYVARTGYTGEDGFEVISPAPVIEKVWSAFLATGGPHGLKPCGLGARDTLRTEACYPLYGHELNDTTTPIEAGLGFFVASDKGEFVGSTVILPQKTSPPPRKLVAFKMAGKSAPPRPDYPIYSQSGELLGQVASGTQSPSLGLGIGLGYVPAAFAQPETPLQIAIRSHRSPAVVVKKPFYKRAK
ncbi:MAG TPA: glycine cleavage system aminomethyltransferase GcvT [Verrucomicrobiae bacterium]|nr:glycine cleavage system aminomethyltransferase GcvT [Verrucomicrobiae bacterium]